MNPFTIIFCLLISAFVCAAVFTVLAPSVSISLPVAPTLPTLTITNSADWITQAGAILYFIGGIIWFFGEYVVYMLSVVGMMLTVFTSGFIPPMVGSFLTVTIMALFVGAILYYVRGQHEK